MATDPISGLNGGVALTTPAAGDKIPITDVSDTTEAPTGTTKFIAVSDLVTGGVVPDDSVTNAKLANMAQATIKGRASGAGTGDPTDLTGTQATAILDNVVGDSGSGGTKGLVPAPGAGDAAAGKYLKADGTFAVPPGTGGGLTADGLSAPVYAADGGSTDAYAITLSPVPSSYTTGTHYRFKANTANTGACTLNVNSLGAKTIKKVQGGITTDLADNDIRAGQFVDVVYDGTNFQMQSNLGNAASGGGPTINATDGRIPYRSSSTAFSDSQLIRHSLYHMARQDSSFTGGNNRIFDWYYSSNDNAASPSSYNRVRLENSAGGDWYLRVQTTGDTPHFHIGPATDTRLYLRNNDTDRAFVNSTGLHSNGDGVYDLGEAASNRWGNIYAATSISSANVKFAGSSETITVGPKSGGNVTQVNFQRSKANAWLDTAQAPGIGGGSATWNLNNGGLIRQTMSANITSAPTVSNAQTDQELEIQIIQDATGSRTMTWPSNFKFAGATAPTLTTTANRRDIFRFRYDGTDWHESSRSMNVG